MPVADPPVVAGRGRVPEVHEVGVPAPSGAVQGKARPSPGSRRLSPNRPSAGGSGPSSMIPRRATRIPPPGNTVVCRPASSRTTTAQSTSRARAAARGAGAPIPAPLESNVLRSTSTESRPLVPALRPLRSRSDDDSRPRRSLSALATRRQGGRSCAHHRSCDPAGPRRPTPVPNRRLVRRRARAVGDPERGSVGGGGRRSVHRGGLNRTPALSPSDGEPGADV